MSSDEETNENAFNEVMIQVGDSGRFQKNYNLLFNFAFIFCATMATFNTFVALAEPEHYCNVPQRGATNYTKGEWKNLTVPSRIREGKLEYSKCEMYDFWKEFTNETTNSTRMECMYDWKYDKNYYGTTISSQENWVCGNELRATNFLVFGKIGEIIGTSVFSQMGDIYGRRPVFYSSIITILIGKLGLLVSSGIYPLYIVFIIIGNFSGLSIFSSPMVISMEISNDDDRAYIPLYQCVAWTLALSLSPLLYWQLGNWTHFVLFSTLPVLPFLFAYKYMIESPRWLAGRGKMKKCAQQLKKITKINKTDLSDKALMSLNSITIETERSYGALGLFSNWKIAKLSLLVIAGWVCYTMTYMIFFLNVSNLDGNPFANYFWQGIAELPGYIVGKYLCDKIGRKFTRLIGFLGLAIISLIMAYFITVPGYALLISICGITLKSFCSIEFYAINLHTLEVYPTCLRQTGSAIGYLVASIFGIFAPYIIHMGKAVTPSLPYVFSMGLTVMGVITGLFLPETLNEKLPETIKEAEEFGKDQKIWSLPRKINTNKNNTNNQKK